MELLHYATQNNNRKNTQNKLKDAIKNKFPLEIYDYIYAYLIEDTYYTTPHALAFKECVWGREISKVFEPTIIKYKMDCYYYSDFFIKYMCYTCGDFIPLHVFGIVGSFLPDNCTCNCKMPMVLCKNIPTNLPDAIEYYNSPEFNYADSDFEDDTDAGSINGYYTNDF
jgi:hypothetical protein